MPTSLLQRGRSPQEHANLADNVAAARQRHTAQAEFLQLESIADSGRFVVRFEAVSAWEKHLGQQHSQATEQLGVDVFLSNGETAHLPGFSFDCVTEAMKDHYGDAFDELFILSNVHVNAYSDAETPLAFVRAQHILAWNTAGTYGQTLHTAGKHELPGRRSLSPRMDPRLVAVRTQPAKPDPIVMAESTAEPVQPYSYLTQPEKGRLVSFESKVYRKIKFRGLADSPDKEPSAWRYVRDAEPGE